MQLQPKASMGVVLVSVFVVGGGVGVGEVSQRPGAAAATFVVYAVQLMACGSSRVSQSAV